MRRSLSAILGLLLILGASAAPTAAAEAKPIKSNFTKMPDLLAAFKAKGVSCSRYSKTPAEYVIEEGVCQFQGVRVLIDLWPTTNYAKSFFGALKKMPALSLPEGSKAFIFYTNNYTLNIDGIPPYVAKAKKVANVIQKKLGIKYVVGKAKKIDNITKTDNSSPAPSPSKSPVVQVAGTWAKPFGWDATIKDEGFKYRLTSFQANATKALCELQAKRAQGDPDDYDLIMTGDLCPQSGDQYLASAATAYEYAVLNLEYTNETQKISYPGSFSVFFKIADAKGKIYETVLLSYQDSRALKIDAVPGAVVPTSVYFKLPKDFVAEGSKIEVSTWNGTFYWSIK